MNIPASNRSHNPSASLSDAGVSRIVIAGAGQAGASAALALRREGFAGEVVLVGDELHLPYERPQLSKEMLRPDASLRSLRGEDDYAKADIQLHLGRKITLVDASSSQLELDDGTCLAYDRLLIATGVRPRRIPSAADTTSRVRYLRSVEDAHALREDIAAGHSLVIIGGGVIGLEVAAAARARGNAVTLIEAADRLMARSVDVRVSQFLDRSHRASGIDIRYGVTVDAIGENSVSLSDGSEIAASRVLVGIGVEPNNEAFRALGITDAAGVRVDEFGRTGISNIFATGDVASQPCAGRQGRIETWANAQDHAINVARNLIGEPQAYSAPTWFWSDQGSINLQVVGDATQGNAIVRGDECSDRFSVFWLDDDGRVTGCATVNSPKDMAMARRWVKQGSQVDPQRLGDPAIQLRECLA